MRRIKEVKKFKTKLENQLNARINIHDNNVIVDGSPLDEYDASRILEAINFGFSIHKALMLKNEDFTFKKIHIKSFTRRNLRDIKARLIGKKGKTLRVISQLSDCDILIRENEVGIVGYVEDVNNTERAIINLIRGTKQSNIYRYLEKINRRKKEEDRNLKV